MPYRRVIFANNEFYHIYNRTVGNEILLKDNYDFKRCISLIDYYRYDTSMSYSFFLRSDPSEQKIYLKKHQAVNPHVEILAYSMMPNHYHFLLKQNNSNGIKRFISNYQNGLAKYINTRRKRHGAFFCNMFQAVRIESEQQLLHVSRYIHLNPVTSYLIDINDLSKFDKTSFPVYIKEMNNTFVSPDLILAYFKDRDSYKKFVFNQADYQRHFQEINRMTLDE
ncbi:hypothetical protein A3J15_01310 [Candidatus Roizmanbacteria bacterium RIFCSPLOWO2_02_FULL_38_10]|uniref:Transposase IS200-like domain-containing protein n=1 Tax=Candidatus Roizmanbacteria bacterium RIFCSPLOWO2_02_FULL_38_10 TaxID=1802074 RepID=A0A1F7JNX5_9BACT|nr:MAG: hypothetical protein A3J15_01310 [Candidatus Roizmanbacteria bacterium RIFCSPLOWO2_02_FULL_38_10]